MSILNLDQRIRSCVLISILSSDGHIIKGNFGYFTCRGKWEKLSGSCLSTISKFVSIQSSDTPTSDGYFRIFWTK